MQIKDIRCLSLVFLTSFFLSFAHTVRAATLAEFRRDIRTFVKESAPQEQNTQLKITIAPLKSKKAFIKDCEAGFAFGFTGLEFRANNTVITHCKGAPEQKFAFLTK